MSEPNFNCVVSNLFSEFLILRLCQKSLHLIEFNPRSVKMLHSWNSITIYRRFSDCFPNLCELNFNCIVLKIFTDISRLCLSRNAIASYRNIPERTQIVNWPIFISIWLKLFQGMSKFCLSQNSIATSTNCSQSFPKSVLANIQLQLIETITRYVQVLS